jgi:hypothetical protein
VLPLEPAAAAAAAHESGNKEGEGANARKRGGGSKVGSKLDAEQQSTDDEEHARKRDASVERNASAGSNEDDARAATGI